MKMINKRKKYEIALLKSLITRGHRMVGKNSKTLCDSLNISKLTFQTAMRPLVLKKLVSIEGYKYDKRIILYRLTDKGKMYLYHVMG